MEIVQQDVRVTTFPLPLASDWPGKSLGSQEHPAIWHMLDVAACAEHLIEGHQAFATLGQNERRACVVLVALHDVGKISDTFRALLRERRFGAYRHWQLSDVLLTHALDPTIAAAYGSDKHTRGELYAAVSGHHGGPERSNDRRELRRRSKAIGAQAERAASEWVSLLLDLLPGGSLEGLTQSVARRLSWALSGLTIASDWVASNAEWFPPASPELDPVEYLKRAQYQAAEAVRKAGLDHAASVPTTGGRSLTGLTNLHPMQRAVETAEFEDGPVLVLIEDLTGSGKTESALILAHRLIASGRGRGLYFALPTMATANAMFDRMTAAVKRLFTGSPSVSLAHGRAALHPDFRPLVGAEDDPTPEAGCTRWLADDRRRSLLAEIGVGTIDQALMGILPTRFSTLRLFGLTDRILVVDEAHAYDRYMQRQLETLLRMQAMNGGSAIVMTATLPLQMRQAYVAAFQKGLGRTSVSIDNRAYPALTMVGANARNRPVDPAPAASREVRVTRIGESTEAVDRIVAGAAAGAACVWVRNAVDEAIEAVVALRRRGCKADLLHARFTFGDRLSREKEAVNRFSRDGHEREGRVLVATQVVEASLDLDFDLMVSDLAPIGALIQRAGRLWRHTSQWPAESRPVDGPTLIVLSPDHCQVECSNWLRPVLGGGAFVYENVQQWRTAKALFDAGAICEPDGLRALIESVHGLECEDIPESLVHADLEAEAAGLAETAHAQQNVVIPEQGYLNGVKGRVWSDERFPTRLGREDATLVLARLDPSGLRPWIEVDTPARSWALSEVRCSRRRLPAGLPDQSERSIAGIKANWPKGKRDHLVLCPVSNDGEICEGLRYDPEYGLLFSS